MSSVTIGFLRGIGMVVVLAVLSYIANATNLTGIVPTIAIPLIASGALALEHYLSKPNTALFGSVSVK